MDPDRADASSVHSIKESIRRNRLSCEVVLQRYGYDRIPLGDMSDEEFADLYRGSWEMSLCEQDEMFEAKKLRPVSVPFDSVAGSRRRVRELNESLTVFTRESREEWSIRFLPPDERLVKTRDDSELSALAVLEKVLNRGRVTVVSPDLEAALNGLLCEVGCPEGFEDAIDLAHKYQTAIVELLKHQKVGPKSHIVAFPSTEGDLSPSILDLALSDLRDLSRVVCGMYQVENFLADAESVRYAGENVPDGSDFVLLSTDECAEACGRDALVLLQPGSGSMFSGFDFIRVRRPVKIRARLTDLEFLLHYLFGFNTFREYQVDGIIRGLSREDSIVLLPTGTGKSIVYQFLSLVTPGISFVVDPINSLIEDQVYNLYGMGIDRVAGIHSDTDKDRLTKEVGQGRYLMSFVSPERFQIQKFLDAVEKYSATNIISVVAIDEAHCVSEWGHDFRTAYLGLARTCRSICKTGDAVPPLLALTGTASPSVLRDMQRDLEILSEDAIIQPDSFDRQELRFRIRNIPSERKAEELLQVLWNELPAEFGESIEEFYRPKGEDTNAGLIFCQNVNGSFGMMASEGQKRHGNRGVWDIVEDQMPGVFGIYSGSKPKALVLNDTSWQESKRKTALDFKGNRTVGMVATKAFGMGIDKPNIRWVVHFGIPQSLESYYQEVGRAGRDRRHSVCYLLLSNDHEGFNEAVLNPAQTPVNEMRTRDERAKGKWNGDDVSRLLWFHSSTFAGIDDEVDACREVLRLSKENWRPDKRFHIPYRDESEKDAFEKAIYRLQLLGVFDGYTIDYAAEEFVVRAPKMDEDAVIEKYVNYIRAYQEDENYLRAARERLERNVAGLEGPSFILEVVRTLLSDFTYKVVEEGRRRAIHKMLDVATAASKCGSDQKAEELFRRQLLDYLRVDKKLKLGDAVGRATDAALARRIVEEAKSKRKLQLLVGQIDRYLEAYPQHYSFFYMRFVAAAKLGEVEVAVTSLENMFAYGSESFGLDGGRMLKDVAEALPLMKVFNLDPEGWNAVLELVRSRFGAEAEALLAAGGNENAEKAARARACYRVVQEVKELVSHG